MTELCRLLGQMSRDAQEVGDHLHAHVVNETFDGITLRNSMADKRFPRRILLATDGLENTAPAARVAADISDKTGSELHVAYVEPSLLGRNPSLTVIASLPPSFEAAKELYEQDLKDALEVLDAGVKQVEDAGGEVANTHLRVGRAAKEIVALSEELGVYLVVVGSRPLRGLRRMLVGSVSKEVVRNMREAAVLVVPTEGSYEFYYSVLLR